MRVSQTVDRDRLQPGKLSVIPEVLRKSGLRAFEDPFVRIIVIQKRQILLELITKEIRNTDFSYGAPFSECLRYLSRGAARTSC